MITTLLTPLFLGNMRGWQLIIVLVVILLLFGGKKIPELMKGLGKGVHAFKQGMQEAQNELNKPLDTTENEDSTPAGKDKE